MIGTTLKGRFAVESELGRGGMGAVYKAVDQVLQRSVAIKVLKELGGDDVGKRIRLEAQILARLLHDNVVRLYDFDEADGTYYFIMEEVDGTSLAKRWKKVEMPERLAILAQVADALDYAHRQGVIHRDVKPGNVLLTSKDQAKLSDFGLSMLSDATQETGIVRGTPHYMSPEQAKGRRLDHRTDLYALGVILYECATGAPPFTGPMMTIMAQHVNAEPEPPRTRNPEISEALESLILSLLSKDPEGRPSSGREVAERLRSLIDPSRPISSGASSAPPSAEAPSASTEPRRDSLAAKTYQQAPSSAMQAFGESRTIRPSPVAKPASPAKTMLDAVTAAPIVLSPEERYLSGHYLGYLLGGSRRRGFFGRRPLDPLNADRARLLLAMTYLGVVGVDDDSLALSARLLDEKPEVRPSLSPVVLAKYLGSRDSPPKRKRFRMARQKLQQASIYAQKGMTDEHGVLNPGLMPQVLADLKRIAPERTELDDQLVARWNRVTEAWRGKPEFRDSVLRYATTSAWRDPASFDLWPEVVYPLIERARWQRKLRSVPEQMKDFVLANLHLPDAGNRLDRAIRVAVPEQVQHELELSLDAFQDDDPAIEPEVEPSEAISRAGSRVDIKASNFADLGEDEPTRHFIPLSSPDPVRQTLGDLRALFQEAIANLRSPGSKSPHRHVPIGPYRLGVVASIRGKTAGQVMIQGMPNKQIEMIVPSFVASGSNTKTILAAWHYRNNSLAITYVDNLNNQRYILWDPVTSQQTNYDDPAELNHGLYQLGLEVPDQLDRVLSKRFVPKTAN